MITTEAALAADPEVIVTGTRLPDPVGAHRNMWNSARVMVMLDGRDMLKEPPADTAVAEAPSGNTAAACASAGGTPTSNPKTDNPVILATGEKFKEEYDFSSSGSYGLSQVRTYRSMQAEAGMFGPHWHSNLEQRPLTFTFTNCVTTQNGKCIPRSVTYTDGTGAKFVFTYVGWTDDGTTYTYKVSGSDAAGELTYTFGALWSLYKNRTGFEYSNSGRLQSITDKARATISYHYQSNGRLSQIVDATRTRTIDFTWNENNRVSAIKDPSGATWTYQYNANNMLAKVIPPGVSAATRQYFYESSDPTLLTGIAINAVRYSTYAYYPDRRVSQSGLAGEEEVDKFTYTAAATTLTDARGQATTYGFTSILGEKKLTTVSRAGTATCGASAAQSFYHPSGGLNYTVDWNGNMTLYTVSEKGQVQSVRTGHGTGVSLTTTNIWVNGEISRTVFKDSAENPYAWIDYTYYPLPTLAGGRVASESRHDVVSGTTLRTEYQYGFHPNGILSSVTATDVLATGNAVTSLHFDALGNLQSRTNALQQTESWSHHNGLGKPGRHVDINGVETAFEYYANGDPLSVSQSGRVTSFAYKNGRLASLTYPSGRVESYEYNAAGRVEVVRNALDEQIVSAVNVAENSVTVSSPRRIASTNGAGIDTSLSGTFTRKTFLDSLGRPYTTPGNNGQRVDYRYDNNGNLLSRTDSAGRIRKYEYDRQNRLKTIIEPDGGITRLEYGPDGLLKSVTDPRSLQTTYTYNGFGNITRLISPDTGTTNYFYDPAGRLERVVGNDGKTVSFSWDLLGRMRSRTSGVVTETFTFDEGAYGIGRLTRINDATGQTSYTYNESGQLTSQVNNIYGQVLTTTWDFESTTGRLVGMSYPTGLTLIYAYDGFGRLASVKTGFALHR